MSDLPKHLTITITPGTLITAILFGVLVWAVFYLRELIFVVLTAIVISSAIEPAAHALIRRGLPRVLSVLSIYTVVVSILFVLFYFFLPPLLRQTSHFLTYLPQYLQTFDLSAVSSGLPSTTTETGNTAFTQALLNLRTTFSSGSAGLFNALGTVFGGVLSFALIFVLSFYFALRDTGIDDFLKLVTPIKHHAYIIDLWRRSQRKIGRWMQGQLILSLIAGVLVYFGLTLLGVQYALLLAIIAAVLELIPVFGSIFAAVPAVAVAFLEGGTSLALLVIGLYGIVNQLQANVIYPLVVQKIVGVPPLLVIIAVIAGAQIAGVLGIILSVPAAAIIQELVTDVQRGRKQLPGSV